MDDSVIELVVGRIGKPHGIKGEVTVDVRTDEPDHRFAVGTVLRAELPKGRAAGGAGGAAAAPSRWKSVTVKSKRWHQGVLLLGLEEVHDRNGAETVRGLILHANINAAETPQDPDEFYDHQLIGLEAVDLEGKPLGQVSRVIHGGAQDLLEVRTPQGHDGLVPFVKELVPEVDLAAGKVVVADRPGLVTPLED